MTSFTGWKMDASCQRRTGPGGGGAAADAGEAASGLQHPAGRKAASRLTSTVGDSRRITAEARTG
jgi:hypothetical protein